MRLQRDSYAPKSCAFDAANVQFLRAHLCKSHPVLQHSEAELKVLLQNGLCPEWQSGVTATITDTQILVAGGKTPREIAAFLENLKKADDLATVHQKLI
ncbi:hypothetical protein [Duodenibacillus massiliensis]|jgi:hypothetical protein|uniref:hypothetical protein n=1 Tax=Duodenibacillus massiliensis TaxID=1852381 RepID=UPI003A8D7465